MRIGWNIRLGLGICPAAVKNCRAVFSCFRRLYYFRGMEPNHLPLPLISVNKISTADERKELRSMTKEAFANVIMDNERSFYHISKSILKNDEDCADAVQEAIAIAFSKLAGLKQDCYAKTWFTRILINECYHLLKDRKRYLPMEQEADSPAETKEYSDLYLALGQLNPDLRITVVLYYIEGFSVKETALIQKISEGTVKSRLSRGREKLKQLLEEQEVQI